MKSPSVKLLLFAVALCCGQHVVAQEVASDSLFFVDGTIAVFNISKNTPTQIEGTYPGETLLSVINKSDLKRIVFRSGGVEVFSSFSEKKPK